MRQNEGTLTCFCKDVNYFLKTHAINDVIARTDDGKVFHKHLCSNYRSEYVEILWNKVIQYYWAYDKYALKCTFIEGESELLAQSMCSYQDSENNTRVEDLVHHPTLFTSFQHY